MGDDVLVQLFPFQQELVDKLGSPDISARLIADEMGCGKTHEAIAIEQRLRSAHVGSKMRTLIIAPWSIHEMWRRKIAELLNVPASDIVVIDRKHRDRFLRAVQLGRAKYYIVHYEALRIKDMAPLQRIVWFHIIADEIHRIKSPKALQTKAFKRLRTQYRTGLSGSMADDRPQDFWSPLHWARPDLFPNVSTKDPTKLFVKDWCETEEFEGRFLGIDDDGNEIHQIHKRVTGMRQDRLAEFHALIAPFYMRRLKEDVLDLPEKVFSPVHVTLYAGQQKVYDQLKREFIAWIGEHEDEELRINRMFVFAQLVRLQQAALASLMFSDTGKVDRFSKPIKKVALREPSAKLDAFIDWASDVSSPVVVFSQSRGMIDLTAARLDAAGARVGVYTGGTPDKVRQQIIDNFSAGKLDFFLGTIKAGGEGVDGLQRASSTMVFFDRAWGPFRNKQAEDRLHREGQKSSVQIVDFYAPKTVDAKVRATNIRKWRDLRQILGDDR
jgi:SNF2 family DNA or RNA helicase